MTSNTNRTNPPTAWTVGAVDAGHDVYYRVTPGYSPTIDDVLVWHWCTAHAPGDGTIVDQGRWAAAGVAAHTLVAADPLHIEPSLLFGCCGKHGFIRAGRWEPA